MKVAIVSHLYPTVDFPYQGKFIQDHFQLLDSIPDIEVDLIVPTPYSMPFTKRWGENHADFLENGKRINRFYYLSLPSKRLPKIIQNSLSQNLARFLKSKEYDLIHLHWLYPDGISIPELNKSGYKTVLTIHGSDWYQSFNKPDLKPIIERSITDVDFLLYSGPKLKTDIEDIYPELSIKSKVAYNIVDSEKYKPISVFEKEAIKISLGWNSSKIHALTVANIRHEKGVDLLVDTIIKNEELSNIQFHIVGANDNSVYSNNVLNKIKTNPYQNIHFLPPVKPDDLVKFYQASDFYILPSRREGFNVSILEAASCGLPLLCTDVGGNKQVTDLGTGYITYGFNNHDPSDILKMASRFRDYEPNNLNTKIKQHFGMDVFKNRLLSIYKSIL